MKLHLGCGKRHIDGWTHVDVVPMDHIDICHDVSNLPMIADGSVSVVYACHVLEHFMRKDVPRVLAEWWRVLAQGGVLRCPVPDFAAMAELYRVKGDLPYIIGPIIGGQTGLYDFHYNLFDYEQLRVVLVRAGFGHVRRYDWRDTEHAGLDDYSQSYYPHMDKDGGRLISLNVEAVKV